MWNVKCFFLACCGGLALVMAAGQALAGEPPKIMTNSIDMEFVLIPAGSFTMGATVEEDKKGVGPRHQVTISKAFYLGKYEVSQKNWMDLMGKNPSEFTGANRPVDNVSWEEMQKFIQRLSLREGRNYRLPTEAEWEYAARAGSQTVYSFGDNEDQLGEYAWYWDNADEQTHPVGQKKANAWGLYDMEGNVSEWVQDWYDKDYYGKSPDTDPKGPEQGGSHVVRGGSIGVLAEDCRVANRDNKSEEYQDKTIGFRLAYTVE